MSVRFRHYGQALFALVAALGVGGLLFIYSGLYDIGADDPHTRPVFAAIQALREHSVERRSRAIHAPNLEDPRLILEGAGHYAAMCTGCHLQPGVSDSELRAGLYPKPPNLSRTRLDPRYAFWVIKHGVKLSAMPAWGRTHDDAAIWSMVAFLEKLPTMSPAQYRSIVAKAPPDMDMDSGQGMAPTAPTAD